MKELIGLYYIVSCSVCRTPDGGLFADRREEFPESVKGRLTGSIQSDCV